MNCFVKESWESSSEQPGAAYDAWVDKLKAAQGSDWGPGETPAGAFYASLRHKVIGEINVIESRCDPCRGYRNELHVSRVEEPQVILLSYLEGGEHIDFGGQRYSVSAGDTFVWDSSKTTGFEVYESLHKVALALPARLLSQNVLNALSHIPRKFDTLSGSRFLLNSLIRAVADRDFDDAEVEAETVLEAVNAFILGAARIETVPEKNLSAQQRREIMAYINRNLSDPSLDLAQIAAAHRISKRYLHWLFREESITVNELIIRKRLEGCKKDLMSVSGGSSRISQIAYSWGFANISHFSKRYRAAYGESPSQTRISAESGTF